MGWGTAYVASEWVIRVAALAYLPPRMQPAAARGWLLLLFLLPWPGLILYLAIGRRTLPSFRIDAQRRFDALVRATESRRSAQAMEVDPDISAPLAAVPRLARTVAAFPVLGRNHVELLSDYDKAIEALIADIDAARAHVHIETYIYATDVVGQRVTAALRAAVQRGVRCCVLLDQVGTGRRAPEVCRTLRAAGVDAHILQSASPFRFLAERYDLRNHRKISVIDGRIGYIGSQNVVRADVWKGHPNVEMVARMRGPIVHEMQAIFLSDRFAETRVDLQGPDLLPPPENAGSSPVQLLPSGPEYTHSPTLDAFVTALYGARHHVVLVSPYFIPPDPLVEAMTSAASRGVIVELIVPRWGNSTPEALAQHSYYEELLEARVRVWRFWPRFLHAKHATVDDEIAIVGSSNLDIRSFALNAEAVALIYDEAVVAALARVEADYRAQAQELTLEEWRGRPWFQRFGESIARLMNTLL